MSTRQADPYLDLAVIDSRAPRFNQAVIGIVALLAVATGVWPLLTLLALQLWLGLTLGRRWCLPCVAYFEWVQPRFGEGPIEDARPPRFANVLGAVVLTAATAAHLAGLPRLGSALGLTVAGLALLASATGFCAGCQVYRLAAVAKGIRTRLLERIDLNELGAAPGPGLVVQFTHPLCADCQTLSRRLSTEGRRVVLVDVSRRPDLARKYGVAVVPLAYAVDVDGRIGARLRG
jgi:hypothetical protein